MDQPWWEKGIKYRIFILYYILCNMNILFLVVFVPKQPICYIIKNNMLDILDKMIIFYGKNVF
jgi:hypothetical protein